MKELSLHILDITQNSIRAGASVVWLTIDESIPDNLLKIIIEDNGKGIPKDMLENITNPFVTTRKTRKVGLGLSLFKEAALSCNGDFQITSEVGKGTCVTAVFEHDHIDRMPLGNMPETIMTMLLSFDSADLVYVHRYNGREFVMDTRELKTVLEADNLLTDPDILNWIKGYVREGLEEIMEEYE